MNAKLCMFNCQILGPGIDMIYFLDTDRRIELHRLELFLEKCPKLFQTKLAPYTKTRLLH